MADRGVPLSVVQGLLGHSEIKTTMRYVQVIDGSKRRAVSALGRLGQEGGLSKWCPNEIKERAS
jgi:hypothetical protein